MLLISSSASAFPEIPFCPIGGPPGWFNRMTDNHSDYRYPPKFYPMPYPPAYQFYPGFQQPYMTPVNELPRPNTSGQ